MQAVQSAKHRISMTRWAKSEQGAYLLRRHALVVLGEELQQAVDLLGLVLHKLGGQALTLGAAGDAGEEGGNDAQRALLVLRLLALLPPLALHLLQGT